MQVPQQGWLARGGFAQGLPPRRKSGLLASALVALDAKFVMKSSNGERAAMTPTPNHAPWSLAEAIDRIERAYEFTLAYAAQGRRVEEDDGGSGIRHHLKQAETALAFIASATPAMLGAPRASEATTGFLDLVKADAARARAVIRFALDQRSIGSRMTDNLNASIHIRALLTDLFLLDESLKQRGAETARAPATG